tara:strand:- start:31 stop:885 length:855 start_codon:yes stop_codon:yes gene_type:complete
MAITGLPPQDLSDQQWPPSGQPPQPPQPPPPPCPPNGRWVTAKNCTFGGNVNWGCTTVDNGQVPQVGQVIDAGATIAGTIPPIPTYFKITNVQPENLQTYPTVNDFASTTHSGCGWDCSATTPYTCVWTGLSGGVSQFGNYAACLNGIVNNECADPSWFCQDFNCFEILYPGGVVWSGPTTNISSADALQTIRNNAPTSCFDPGEPWENVITLKDIYNAGPCHGYFPLSHSVNGCINCCGGLNIQLTGSGQINPLYAWNNANPGAGSGSLIAYAATLGADSCGQ